MPHGVRIFDSDFQAGFARFNAEDACVEVREATMEFSPYMARMSSA
jgi:hypothetical protein